MNAPCDNEERPNNDYESRVINSGANNPRWLSQDQKVVKTNNAGECEAKFVVVALPMMLRNQRAQCDRQQKDCERHQRESAWLGGNKIQARHCAIWDNCQRSGKPNSLDSCRCQREVSGFKFKTKGDYLWRHERAQRFGKAILRKAREQ